MFTKATLMVLVTVVLTGCTAYEPPALTAEHPAHPDAAVVPEGPRSTTLAYRISGHEEPATVRQTAQAGMQHGQGGAEQSMSGMHGGASARPQGQLFQGEGKVIAVVPGSQVVLDHKPIPGLMDAMTMGYKVDPPSVLKGLEAGDVVRFTIDAGKNAVVAIEKLQ